MDSAHDSVWLLFIGGPLHGSWRELPGPVARYEHHLDDGGMVPYAPRVALAQTPGQVVFAPVGMTDQAISELAAGFVTGPPKA
jgi:hypothetical protein